MEQYVSRRDLICWFIKHGTESRVLNNRKKFTLEEIMKGINDLPFIKMADKEKLMEFGIWEPAGEERKRSEESIFSSYQSVIFEDEEKKKEGDSERTALKEIEVINGLCKVIFNLTDIILKSKLK